MFTNKISTLSELRELYEMPRKRTMMKELTALEKHSQAFIALSPFFLMATADAKGRCDVSPRGDSFGFVKVLDDKHLAFPDRPGNNRLDGFSNLFENPHIGMLFLIPGRGDTLRVNGKAWIVKDNDLLNLFVVDGKRPKTAVGVEIEEIFLHCPRAFIRSQIWKSESWLAHDALPKFAEMLWEQFPEKPIELEDAQEYDRVLNELDEQNLY